MNDIYNACLQDVIVMKGDPLFEESHSLTVIRQCLEFDISLFKSATKEHVVGILNTL
jgi:hypothetical protein